MRRFLIFLLCVFVLAAPVFAANAAESLNSTSSVSPSGTCQITLNLTIRLDTPVSSLSFPLGSDVSGVTLNGGAAGTTQNSVGITAVKLNHLKNQTGTFPLTIHYTIGNVVQTDPDTGKQSVSIPLLSGFPYPVEQMSFSVTMPGEFTANPTFFSGYHEQDIERSITYDIHGAVISGTSISQLKDSETLRMTLEVPEGMFPPAQALGGSLASMAWVMGISAGLGLVYWLATMSRLPNFPTQRSTPPEGFSAGLVGSYLSKRPADLTLMVVHWAQLGYLIIHLDDNGRVILHKKMDMGNERSSFERRCFRNLFAKKQMIEATGYRYARLRESTAKQSQRFSAGFRRDSGNPMLLRLLGTAVGAAAGVALGDCLSGSLAWRVIFMMLFAVAGGFAAWQIQKGMCALCHYKKLDLYLGLGCAVLMVLSGLLAPAASLHVALAAAWCLISGLLACFGGKRTENGGQIYTELTALRRYMRTVTKPELTRILRANPDYYYELAPFAFAFGADRTFARQFESLRIPGCTWLLTGGAAPRTPEEWYPLLRETVQAMNALSDRPFWEKYSR